MLQDVRYAIRMMAVRPWTAIASIVVLAIAIAGGVVTFCLADAVLWHPVPFRDPERLVNIRGFHPAQPNQISVPSSTLDAWSARDQVISAVYVWSGSRAVIDSNDLVEAVSIARVSPGLITELGVPVLGRDFSAADFGQRVAILSEAFVRSHYRSPQDALGQFIRIDGDVHAIIGVAPRDFSFPLRSSVWLPPSAGPPPARVRAIARIRPKLTFAQAAELTASTTRRASGSYELRLAPLVAANASTSQAIVVSLAAMLCLLAVGVANASNLVLAEAIQRRGEMAVRRALGASSRSLIRQVVVETGLRSAAAVVLALVAVLLSLDAIAKGVPRILTYQSLRPLALDWRALAFAGVLAAGMAIAAAVAPCLQIVRGDLLNALQSGAPSAAPRSWVRDGLTMAQLAASVVLLAAAGVLVNGFVRLMHVHPGYDADGLTVLTLELPSWRYGDKAYTNAKLRTLRSEVMSIPGVTAASIADGMPPYMSFQSAGEIETPDGASLAESGLPVAFASVDDGYFSTLGIPLISGAGLSGSEVPSVVVTKSLAERLWPARDPIGRRFRLSADDPWLTVMGVAGDVRLGGFDQPLGTLAVFVNTAGTRTEYWFHMLVVRSAVPPRTLVALLRASVSRTLPGVPVTGAKSAAEIIADEHARVRFVTQLMSALGITAIVLSMIGVYAAFWCTVTQRQREIGVRLAIGAAPHDVVVMVVVESLRVIGTALVAGIPLALGATFAVKPLLFEVSPMDPSTMIAVVILLIGCALAAAYLPARYASRIDPVETLRAQ